MARAKGEVKTGARLIREFVLKHPAYKQDSIVSSEIAFDLVKSIMEYSSNLPDRPLLEYQFQNELRLPAREVGAGSEIKYKAQTRMMSEIPSPPKL